MDYHWHLVPGIAFGLAQSVPEPKSFRPFDLDVYAGKPYHVRAVLAPVELLSSVSIVTV